MKYVALMRGINVGGKNSVSMPLLASAMTKAGFDDVKTYINSGNVLFEHTASAAVVLATRIADIIATECSVTTTVVVIPQADFQTIAKQIPDDWQNDVAMKCDVMFLWPEVDQAMVSRNLTIKAGIDDVIQVDSAIIWRVDRDKAGHSGIQQLARNPLYKQMTIRNCNTVRTLSQKLSA